MRSLQLFNLDKPNGEFEDSAFKVYAKDDTAELLIMEEIGENFFGEGLKATDVVGFLGEHKGQNINVRVNSPGGYVYDGMVVYNALAQHDGTVTATVEGLAHSAASLITMAADKVRMHQASDFGIHRAWGGAVGNAKVMRGLAEWLDNIDSHLVDVYAARSGQSRAQIEDWLDGTDDGTIFTGAEAVAAGFADELIEIPSKAAAKNIARHHEMLRAQLKAKHARFRHG